MGYCSRSITNITIESQFYGYCTGESPRVLVDLSDAEFLASMGIRLLILNAKSVFSRGGRMALLRPKTEIRNRLEITDVAMIILIYDGLESAEVMLLA